MQHLRRDRLTPGVVDSAAHAAFLHGACEAFAVAVHDRTGWPLVKITDPHNVFGHADTHGIRSAGSGSAVHWAVLAPDGHLVDIAGAHDAAELVSSFDDHVDEPDPDSEVGPGAKAGYADRDDALEEGEAKSGELTHLDAEPFVEVVLTAAGYTLSG